MKHRFVLGIAALALVVTACTAAPAGLTPEDEAAIRSLFESYDQAVVAGDWDALAGLFAEDVVIMGPNNSLSEGRSTFLTSALSSNQEFLEHHMEAIRIEGRGDLAFAQLTFTGKQTMEGVAEPIEDVGKSVKILRKQADGSWLLAVNIWNSDLPLPE
jgi:uncharacterized protein (TIGR02246 family)